MTFFILIYSNNDTASNIKIFKEAIINQFQLICPVETKAINEALNYTFYQICETFTYQVGILYQYLRDNGVLVSYERIVKMFN